MSNALKFLIEMDASQAKQALASFQSSLTKTLRDAAGGVPGNPFASIGAGAAGATASLGGLASSFLSLKAVAVAAAGAFAKASIDASESTENAFRGLESVANRTGVGITKAWSAVQQITSDGLLSQTQAATALKNLFARGFGLEEAVTLIERFKDSAAFGRQASLDFGDAVVSATEGLRNENSQLVDNAGVTKNVAKMWDEYAKSIGVGTNELTDAQKRQAEYNGIVKETRAQLGDAKKLQDGLSGANARLAKSFTDLKTVIGDDLKPGYTELLNLTTKLLDKTNEYLKTSKEVMKPQALVENKGSVGFIARGTRALASAVGIDLPALPEGKAAIPPLSTNKTGIKVVGPGGRELKDNVDTAAVAAKAREEADAKAKAEAKQELERTQRRLKREADDSKNAVEIYASGLAAQRAVLDKHLAEGKLTQEQHARSVAALEVQEAVKAQDARSARLAELRKAEALAAKTGNAEALAEAQQNVRDEEAAIAVGVNRIAALRTKASTDSVQKSKQEAEQRRRIDEQLLAARVEAERTTGEAIRDREIAAVEAKVSARVLTEEEGIRAVAALKDAELVKELERLRTLKAFYEGQTGLDPSQAAAASAQAQKLTAQVTATEAERAKLTNETNGKIAESSQRLNQLRVDLEQELLEVQGRTFEAQSAQIDAWLEEKKKQLAAFPELLAKAEAVASGKRKNLAFEQTQETISQDSTKFQRDQDELYRRSQAGLITDIQYDLQSVDLKKKQADILRERLELLKQNSNGSASAVAAIQTLEMQIVELDAAMSQTAKSINDNFFSAVEQGFQDMLTGAKKPLEALRDVALSVLKQIASMALRSSLQQAFAGFGGGGGLGGAVASLLGGFRASGGAVSDGQAYITGERGPELFFPGNPGNVVTTARIKQVLSGMLSSKTMSPAAYLAASRQAQAVSPGNTSVSVAPKVVVAAGDFLTALQGMPEFEKYIVQVAAANGKRIQGGW